VRTIRRKKGVVAVVEYRAVSAVENERVRVCSLVHHLSEIQPSECNEPFGPE